MKLPADSYYGDRPVRHSAQGDLYEDVPHLVALGAEETGRSSGARKRPLPIWGRGRGTIDEPRQSLAVVCNYTCTFVAQPPGTPGYSHPVRQIAPVVPLATLINKKGMQRTEARRLRDVGMLSGILYVPRPPNHRPDPETPTDDEFTPDDYAVCLWAISAVHQSVLDVRTRVARMTLPAQKILTAALITVVAPVTYDPDDLEDPDMSSSW